MTCRPPLFPSPRRSNPLLDGSPLTLHGRASVVFNRATSCGRAALMPMQPYLEPPAMADRAKQATIGVVRLYLHAATRGPRRR